MRQLLTFLLALALVPCFAQPSEKYNLGFETRNTEPLSVGWFQWGTYSLSIDSQSHSGNYSGKITSSQGSFGSIAYRIPANYTGKSITLRGYIKTKGVSDGHAGLLLRLDRNQESLAFDNMRNNPIKGTTDWQAYEITLPYPKEADAIYVAGILSGKGEAWFDDFVVSIDGQDIQTLKEAEKVVSKAKLDTAFNKGSGISLAELSTKQIDDLSLLARVWGFLKYHHPEIAKGNYNWDYELFRFLPRYLKANNAKDRDDLLVNWIQSLGSLQDCTDCPSAPTTFYLKADLGWINAQDDKLKSTLTQVYTNRNRDAHHYIDLAKGIGNPIFKNEEAYSNMPYPDDGFRLLALYRYWNVINYFFPYKYVADKDWNTVLTEYLPLFIQASDELSYEQATLKLIAEVHDTHANLRGAADKIQLWKGMHIPIMRTQFIGEQLVISEFLNEELRKETGLAVGDIIHRINDVPVNRIIEERLPYYPASNRTTQLSTMSNDLLRSDKPTITIVYSSIDNIQHTKTLQLYTPSESKAFVSPKRTPPASYTMLDNNIGYVTLKTIKQEDIPQIKETFSNTKGIIIDIRNYPSSFVPFTLGSFFISGSSPFVKFTTGDIHNPGYFTLSESLTITNNDKHYSGPLVVLVNEQSISQSEYTAMAFRAGVNTTIIGSTTAGADGNVSALALPGGLQTAISGIGIYYPDGKETQRVGIVPDIEAKPTVSGVRAGKDEVLEKAIEFILNK